MKKLIAVLCLLFGTAAFSDNGFPKLLTILLKHDQTKSLDEIQAALTRNQFYAAFPPAGSVVVSWNVVMGIGQILVIEVPGAQVDAITSQLAQATSGAFNTEVYVSENKYPTVAPSLANKKKKTLDQSPVAATHLLMTFVLKPIPGKSAPNLYAHFPPPGSTVVSWFAAQGLGDIVTLEFAASMLRTVNLSLEKYAWGAYTTGFYASYDFYPPARDSFKLKNTAKKAY